MVSKARREAQAAAQMFPCDACAIVRGGAGAGPHAKEQRRGGGAAFSYLSFSLARLARYSSACSTPSAWPEKLTCLSQIF
jgi:hypothetical protein